MNKDIYSMGVNELMNYKEKVVHSLMEYKPKFELCDEIDARLAVLYSDCEAVYSEIDADSNDFEH